MKVLKVQSATQPHMKDEADHPHFQRFTCNCWLISSIRVLQCTSTSYKRKCLTLPVSGSTYLHYPEFSINISA
ncbi:hypothetical protein CROQUDRAFT_281867 [Cronartium quercuum f. sp. fusiforme G11]|uniref:Uncharacterized protein n=1 Tax=Cronartium quercuum f. sp. fusiforme G11 TaxID=708437 RepID=A0A9P6T8K1_9BASI|nr:hypothetical protein CROQUDRAFT_281856 [Cronartium quercuum f. sp. fusiforme G11]KAG0141578.1 hypothetical protein CROQUDRAFT_281867 [Cronartium quercuum f. sp. fusiforme G11]